MKQKNKIISFALEGDYIELIRLLKALNLVETGGQAKMMVNEGRVKVNGVVEIRKRAKLRIMDRIEFDGNEIIIG